MCPRPQLPRGPFTSGQAGACGRDSNDLTELVRTRTLRRLFTDVYLHRDEEVTTLVLARAASLVISEHSVIRDRSAAMIWAVDPRTYTELDGEIDLETCVLRGHDPTDRAEIAGGQRDLTDDDWVWVEGVRVTTPLRTAMDLGCLRSRRRSFAAMCALMRAHGFTQSDMVALLPRYRRRRGCVQLRRLVPIVTPEVESEREAWTLLEISDSGLPHPEPQYWIVIEGVPTYRLDFAYPHARIAVEYDGEEFHTSDADREADQTRRQWLRDQGWIVIVLTKKSFESGAEIAWIAEIRNALRERAPHLLKRSVDWSPAPRQRVGGPI